MDKKKQDLQGQAPVGDTFVPTEMGSARFASLDTEGTAYKYESDPESDQAFMGPPWGMEPSMSFVCDEVGIDYDQFVKGLKDNKNDNEMASELGVNEKTIKNLKERFYQIQATNGNTGIGG